MGSDFQRVEILEVDKAASVVVLQITEIHPDADAIHRLLGKTGEEYVARALAAPLNKTVIGPAAARLITVFGARLEAADVIGRAHALLKVMDAELGQRSFLTGDQPTIADIAGYTYIAHAPEGNVSLAEYPGGRAWLARIEALPGFLPMQMTRVGLATG